MANSLGLDLKPGQSIELLKELHILTRDGKINQDSRRKLKQVYHLYHFIEPLLQSLMSDSNMQSLTLVDHGSGKSYLGFILYDLFFKNILESKLNTIDIHVIGIENRAELVEKAKILADKLQFSKMSFFPLTVAEATKSKQLPENIDVVTALHACDAATDEALQFGLLKRSKHIVLVPCCQAEVASVLRKNKAQLLSQSFSELFREPLHTREFGSHLTNVLRVLKLKSAGYSVTVTELIGFEHSMKNELIIASLNSSPDYAPQVRQAKVKLQELVNQFRLNELSHRF